MTNANKALAMFERSIGYQMLESLYHETIRIPKPIVPLRHTPFQRLITVKGRTEAWEYVNYFGSTAWQDVPVDQIAVYVKDDKASIELPPSTLGAPFTEVDVTYTAGVKGVPQDAQKAIKTIETLLERREISEWSFILPEDVQDVIHKYRKEVG